MLQRLSVFYGEACSLMILDIKDVYYSVKEDVLLCRLRYAVGASLVAFQAGSGIALHDLLRLVDLYLFSTATVVGGSLFVQVDGIYIGSPVAPILSEVYLNVLHNLVTNFVTEARSAEMSS